MTAPDVALVVTASLYAGFQWTVRSLVYPQLARVPRSGAAAFERAHQRAVAVTVGPLFGALGLSCFASLALQPALLTALAAACFAGVLALTAFGAVPQHRRLSDGFDATAHRRLLAVDSGRLVLALAVVVFAVAQLTS